MEFGQAHSMETFQMSGPKTFVGEDYMDKIHWPP